MTRTTLSAAMAASDKQVTLASISGLAVGNIIQVDGEKMRVLSVPSAATLPVGVYRGVAGTNVVAHPTSAGAAFGTPDEFTQTIDLARRRQVRSYSAAGAIDLPTPGNDGVAIINGTSALAMTLANPGADQDGDMLIIVANGKAAHTLTYTAGLGNGGASFDVATFSASLAGGLVLVAAGGYWVAVGAGILNATAAVGAPLVA